MVTRAEQVTRGAGWIYFYRWLDRLLAFVSVAVLARLLLPDDFGLVAVAASYVAIVEGLSELDVNRALVQSRDEHRDLYDSAWTLSCLRGVVAALVMVAVAPLAVDERVSAAVLVLAAAPLLTGLSNPRFVMFERELDYSRLALQTLAGRVASLGVTLAVALTYRSYWALVFGILASSAVMLCLSYVLRPYRPRFTFVRWRAILSFSGWMSLANAVTTLSMNTDRIIVARLLGTAETGYYFMAQRVGMMPTAELISPLQRVLFPSFSQIALQPERLRRAVSESVNVLASLSLPAAFGFALVANDFVALVLGERWMAIVPLMIVLVPFLGVRATLSMTQPCVMALGRTELMFRVSFLYALIHLPMFIAGTWLYGLRGAVWSIALAGIAYVGLNAWLLRVTLGIGIGELLARMSRPLLASVVMVSAVLWLRDLVSDVGVSGGGDSAAGSWLRLAVSVAVGVLAFVVTLALSWRAAGRPEGIERRALEMWSRLWGRWFRKA